MKLHFFPILSMLICTSSFAATEAIQSSSIDATSIETSNDLRPANQLGAYMSVFGDPAPSFFGINVMINTIPYVRVNGGVGSLLGFGTTFGVGVSGVLLPERPFTPFIGASFSYTHITDFLSPAFGMTAHDESVTSSWLNLGVEYQAASDIMLKLGGNFRISQDGTIGARVLPYVAVGTYF